MQLKDYKVIRDYPGHQRLVKKGEIVRFPFESKRANVLLQEGYIAPEIVFDSFDSVVVSHLANVMIADKDYSEGDKKYFTFDEACEIEKKLNNGWRLPTRKEWVLICEEFACNDGGKLDSSMLMDKLKLGLNGYQEGAGGIWDVGAHGLYWSSVADSATYARHLSFNPTNVYPSYGDNRAYGFSVRLVKDVE